MVDESEYSLNVREPIMMKVIVGLYKWREIVMIGLRKA